MKYLVILADGMADVPVESLQGKTPLEAAETACMDTLASKGEMGMVRTVPMGMKPGSDLANLSVLGYDPAVSYSGRSPLEALSVGVSMKDTDIIFRCNIVTLTEEEPYEEKTILDHSSGEIFTEDADILMDAVRAAFNNESFRFFTGTSYRHITVWDKGSLVDLEPPHDHLGCKIGAFLPAEPALREMMEKSFDILNNHPLNLARAAKGLRKANSLWFWGAGTKPALQNFREKTGLQGAMISAVDLLKGIAMGTGMAVYPVSGANGSWDTNYEGKAQAAIQALLQDGKDFAYIHLEGPDEMGHQGEPEKKVYSIAAIDSRVLKPVLSALEEAGEEHRVLILPDHPTPLHLRTHTADPVPYVLYDSRRQQRKIARYCESEAALTGIFVEPGHSLMNRFLEKE